MNSRINGQYPAKVLRERRSLSHRPEWWWSPAVLRRYIGPISYRIEKKVLFHHDTAATINLNIANAKLVDLGYELLTHPPYSPDLTPLEYLMFTISKINFRTEISVERDHRRHGGAFFRPRKKVFFKKVKKTWASLGQIYRDYIKK